MGIHLLTPIEADVMIWTAAGLCVLIMLTKKFGWPSIVTSLIVAEITMVAFIVPILMFRATSVVLYRPIAFGVGFGGTYVLGALVNVLERLREDPEGTVSRLWGLWKNRNQGGEG